MELSAASLKGKSCIFQLETYISPEKKNHPTVEIVNIGINTPQTVTPLILPVISGPQKLKTVVNQITKIVYTQVIIGVSSIQKKVQPYPTAEIAIATLETKIDTLYT